MGRIKIPKKVNLHLVLLNLCMSWCVIMVPMPYTFLIKVESFATKFWMNFYNLTGIRPNITSAYHPKANGEVERLNRTTQECLAKCQEFNENFNSTSQPDWHKKIYSVLFAYRGRKQTSTRISPFRIMYGCEAVLPWEREK